MLEDPEIIRLNILHLQALLKLHCTPETRRQVEKLLAEAEAALPLAAAEAADRRR